MSGNVSKDLIGTFYVNKGYRSRNYDKVYYSTNEQIESLFSSFDFKDKNVLSVLSSGDQALYFLYNGAKRVDVFDQNKLTKYYYFLRLWCIKYLDELYPSSLNKEYIGKILKYVKPESDLEKEAYDYWRLFGILLYNHDIRIFDTKAKTNYYLFNINELQSSIENYFFDFYNINLFQRHNIRKKYDVIYTSNILEWVSKDKEKNNIKIYMNNIKKLLKKDGIVISSCINKKQPSRCELKIMEKYFDCFELESVFHRETSSYRSLGYYYKRK